MASSVILAASRTSAAAPMLTDSAEHRLRRFPSIVQSRVRSLTARHPWIADLSVSFPALLFALAYPRVGVDGQTATSMVVAGAPLSACAKEAGVAMWLRRLPPEACAAPIPVLPDGIDFRRRIANLKPRLWRLAPQWLERISETADYGDDEIALWFAREAPIGQPKRRQGRRKPRNHWRLVCLWAWYSRNATTVGHLFPRTPWNAALKWKAAQEAAMNWREDLALQLYLGGASIADVWLEPGLVDGFEFRPLRTAAEIEAEAMAMQNCVRGYGSSLAGNDYRLWSVRKDGSRVATLSLNAGYPDGPLPCIAELSGEKNSAARFEVWRAARRWVFEQDRRPFDPARLRYRDARFDAAAWRATWRPYWIAKQRIPTWLPLAPVENGFFEL